MIHISQIVIHVLAGVIRGFMYHDAYFNKMAHSVVTFLMRRSTGVIHIQVKVHTEGDCVYLYSNLSHFFIHA